MAWTSRSGAGDFLAKKPTQIGLYAGVTGAVRGARVDGAGRSAASSMQALQGCPVGEPEHLDARDLARSWPCRSALGLPLELSKLPSAGATASTWLLCSCPHAPGLSALAIPGHKQRQNFRGETPAKPIILHVLVVKKIEKKLLFWCVRVILILRDVRRGIKDRGWPRVEWATREKGQPKIGRRCRDKRRCQSGLPCRGRGGCSSRSRSCCSNGSRQAEDALWGRRWCCCVAHCW